MALAAILISGITGSATAADLDLRGPVVEEQVVVQDGGFDWTGAHIGVNAGANMSHSDGAKTVGTAGFVGLIAPGFAPGLLDTSKNGFIGGAQIGYDVQHETFVFGVEADLSFTDQKKKASFTGAYIPPPLGTTLTTSASTDLNYLGTMRGRMGVTPTEHLLLYATGGLAFGEVDTTASVVANAAPTLNWNGNTSKKKVGWAIGAGAEYAISENVTLRGEYIYYDLGSVKTDALGNAAVRGVAPLNGVDYLNKTDINGSIVRAAMNFKF